MLRIYIQTFLCLVKNCVILVCNNFSASFKTFNKNTKLMMDTLVYVIRAQADQNKSYLGIVCYTNKFENSSFWRFHIHHIHKKKIYIFFKNGGGGGFIGLLIFVVVAYLNS